MERQSGSKNKKGNSSAQNSQSKQGTDFHRSNGKDSTQQCKDEASNSNDKN